MRQNLIYARSREIPAHMHKGLAFWKGSWYDWFNLRKHLFSIGGQITGKEEME